MKAILLRALALLLVLVLTLSLCTACSLDGLLAFINNVNSSFKGGEDGGEDGGSKGPLTPPVLEGSDLYNRAYYQTLTDEEKLIYTTLYQGFSSLSTSVEVGEASSQYAIFRAFSAVLRDYPTLFWMNGGASLSGETLLTTKYTITPYILQGEGSLAEMKAALDGVVAEVVANARQEATLYEQILYIHDYLVNNCVYDSESVDDIMSASGSTVHPSSTAYGCLVKGKAVCAGYAAAFSILLQELGVPCIRVRGSRIGGEAHEWNALNFDGESYYVDVTWNDPVTTDGSNTLSHLYYFINEAELTKTHAFRENKDENALDEIIPTCTATEYEYYRYFGYYCESYSRTAFQSVAQKQKDNETVTARFGSLSALRAAKTDLVDNGYLRSVPALALRLGGKAFTYAVNEEALTVTFYLP